MPATSAYVVESLLDKGPDVLLYRARARDGRAVLLKAPRTPHPSPADHARLRRELEATRQLAGDVAVEVQALSTLGASPVLVLADAGGKTLASLLGAAHPVEEVLALSIRIALVVAIMHERRVVHLGIEPHNVLLMPDGTARLTGFGQASATPEGHAAARAAWPPGMWPFLSPEQTGRLGLPIDHRSDLYSLGVILFQLITGKPPFAADDLLGWIHCHCAVAAPSLRALVPELPAQVAGIITKLLAKLPEDRYQSARGLLHDLERCLEAWRAAGRVDPFPLGECDAPPPLRLLPGLYGREGELSGLREALGRVRRSGEPELVLLSGPPGIGKTELFQELRIEVPPEEAIFAVGKCDAIARAVPHAAIFSALEDALEQALEEAESIAALRERFPSAIRANAPLLASALPVLERILGRQPPPPALPPHEAERRFQALFSQLLAALARPERPLVVFLDDLQWADAGTRSVLSRWITDPEVRHALIVGAYRSDSLLEGDPLLSMMDLLRQRGARLHEARLGPLTGEAVARWMAGSLRATPEEVAPLAALVHETTGGNPFFIEQLVSSLNREGLIRFSASARAFRWDLPAIRAQHPTEDVTELIAASLSRLAPATQRALSLFACHGGSVDVHTLAILLDCSEQALGERLEDAFAARLIKHDGNDVRFVHDRIHQVVYERIPPEERPGMHLGIARALVARTPPERLAGRIFDIIHHLSASLSLLASSEERAWAAGLYLMAGKKAQATTSFTAAIGYLATGAALLGSEGFSQNHELALGLHVALAQCRLSTGDTAGAEALCVELLGRTRDALEAAPVFYLLTDLQVIRADIKHAIEHALRGLSMLGVTLPLHPTDAEVDAAVNATLARLARRPARDLAEDSSMTDPRARAACDLVTALHAPAAYTDWNLFALACCAAIDLSLEHGNTGSSAAAYANFGYCLATRYGRHRDAFALGEMAYRLAQRPESMATRSRAAFSFVALLSYLGMPIRSCLALLAEESGVAVGSGDHPFSCYFGNHTVDFRLFAGDPLDEVAEEAIERRAFAESARDSLVQRIVALQQRLVDTLRGTSREDPLLAEIEQHCWIEMGQFLQHVYELQGRFILGDLEGAWAAAGKARALEGAALGFLQAAEYHFYTALTIAARHSPKAAPGPALQAELRAHADQLRALAGSCAANFEARLDLVEAEMARLAGDEPGAERSYEKAISGARAGAFVQVEAIAAERCAHFYRHRGLDIPANAYLAEAQEAYEAWGARAKVMAMARAHPELARHVSPLGVDRLEMLGILKASQAITGALVLPDLQARLLSVALEHAGAERGCLLLGGPRSLVLAAASGAGAEEFGVVDQPVDGARLPLSLCRLSLRTHKPLLLADAAAPHRHAADPYFQRKKGARRSILCVPIVRQDEPVGLLYLENNMIPGAFSSARLGVLDVLASQAAISLENARLYTELRQENAERRRAEASLQESQAMLRMRVEGEQRARAEAEEAVHLRDEFLSIASHELRTPLTSLKLAVERLEKGHAQDMDAERVRWAAALAGRQIKRLDTLVDSLLDVSRIQAGMLQPQRTTVDLCAVVRAAAAELSDTLARAGSALAVHAEAPVMGAFDGPRMEQVVTNLLTNAIKFGEGRPIDISVTKDGRAARIVVKDRGIGIPAEVQGEIFERFRRGVSSRHYGGLGLGLYIARTIVEAHGGRVRVESAVGSGSTFIVELPLAPPAPGA
jgi:predicted ATPase/signal transduction histidine kinase